MPFLIDFLLYIILVIENKQAAVNWWAPFLPDLDRIRGDLDRILKVPTLIFVQ